MRSADRIAAAALLALAAAFAANALVRHDYWTRQEGPGPGFLPFWLGLGMALLALAMLIRAFKQKDPGVAWAPRGAALRHVLVVLGATVAFVALLNVLGMAISSVLFLAFVMRYMDRTPWPVTAAVALGAAGAIWLIFAYWLRVPFPPGPLGF